LRICREIGERYGACIALLNSGLVSHNQGDNETAHEYSQQALELAQSIGSRTHQGYTWTVLGHVLAGLGRLAEAMDAYHRALALRRELNEHHLVIESLAGLSLVSLAQNDLDQAQAQVEEILSYLEDNTLDGTEEPFRVYLTCYRVLHAGQDARAGDVLGRAYRLLQERSAKIGDEEMRRAFLENVPYHRDIVAAWETRNVGLGGGIVSGLIGKKSAQSATSTDGLGNYGG